MRRQFSGFHRRRSRLGPSCRHVISTLIGPKFSRGMRGCARWWAQMQTRSQQPIIGLLTQETTAAAPLLRYFICLFCFSPPPSAHFLAGGLHYPTSTPSGIWSKQHFHVLQVYLVCFGPLTLQCCSSLIPKTNMIKPRLKVAETKQVADCAEETVSY